MAKKPQRPEIPSVAIEVPRATVLAGYASNNVQVWGLNERQTDTLAGLTASLRLVGARYQAGHAATAAGIVVDKPADAIKWFLDQLADANHVAAAQEEGGTDG